MLTMNIFHTFLQANINWVAALKILLLTHFTKFTILYKFNFVKQGNFRNTLNVFIQQFQTIITFVFYNRISRDTMPELNPKVLSLYQKKQDITTSFEIVNTSLLTIMIAVVVSR